MNSGGLTIRMMVMEDLPVYFLYLDDHLRDNGSAGTALFMPMPRGESRVTPDRQAAFRSGMETPVGQPGWRRGWLALTPDGRIAGHIDLRARPEKASAHRALLGMGVHRQFRQQGLGAALLKVAQAWAAAQDLAWIDLEVLSANAPARQLYAAAGFTQVGRIEDLFRIDGASLGYIFMAKKVNQ